MKESGVCQEAGTVPASAGVRLRWSHISEHQVIQAPCAPFLKCHHFPEGISSPLIGVTYYSQSDEVTLF